MTAPHHHVPLLFPVINNELIVGGLPITRLAARVGRTPFYVYDRVIMQHRVQCVRQAFGPRIKLYYAIKANPMPAVVQQLAQWVDGFDVASTGELRTALDTIMPPKHISFTGPGKQYAELRQAIAAGVVINVESAQELRLVGELGHVLAVQPNILIRINPLFELKSAGMKMGGSAKPFGIDPEQVSSLFTIMQRYDIDCKGFHIYAGSQNLRADAILTALEQTLLLIQQLQDDCPYPIQHINLGGGLGIPYFPGERPLDLATVGAGFNARLAQARGAFPYATFGIELGRALVGEAGLYVARVLYRKYSRERLFIITDGGLHHHLAAAGHLGQVVRKNYPVLIANRVQATTMPLATVVGPLCTPLDVLAENMPLGHAQEDDLIAILQSGAYGFTASPTAFLGHHPPLEVLV